MPHPSSRSPDYDGSSRWRPARRWDWHDLSQTVIVPRSGWGPLTLLQVGTAITAAGFVVPAVDSGVALLILGIALIGVGLGIAAPGYTAGPTLPMSREEQGGFAGLIGATNGLTSVLAPTLSTALYSVNPVLPMIVGAVVMLFVFLFVLTYPGFKTLTGPASTKVRQEASRG